MSVCKLRCRIEWDAGQKEGVVDLDDVTSVEPYAEGFRILRGPRIPFYFRLTQDVRITFLKGQDA